MKGPRSQPSLAEGLIGVHDLSAAERRQAAAEAPGRAGPAVRR